jgi:hypothetical protein
MNSVPEALTIPGTGNSRSRRHFVLLPSPKRRSKVSPRYDKNVVLKLNLDPAPAHKEIGACENHAPDQQGGRAGAPRIRSGTLA